MHLFRTWWWNNYSYGILKEFLLYHWAWVEHDRLSSEREYRTKPTPKNTGRWILSEWPHGYFWKGYSTDGCNESCGFWPYQWYSATRSEFTLDAQLPGKRRGQEKPRRRRWSHYDKEYRGRQRGKDHLSQSEIEWEWGSETCGSSQFSVGADYIYTIMAGGKWRFNHRCNAVIQWMAVFGDFR